MASDRANIVPINQPGGAPRGELAEGVRLKSLDYGTGTIVAMLSIGVQIYWDTPLVGTTDSHLLVHDRSYVERLERL